VNRMIPAALLIVCSLLLIPVAAETRSFALDDIQEVIPGPNAVHPREMPVGSMHGLARVEFALAYVNDDLQFYATVYDSPDYAITFSVSARLYHSDDQLIGYFGQSPRIQVPAASSLFPMGGAFYTPEGGVERLTKFDLENLKRLRLEVTWVESN